MNAPTKHIKVRRNYGVDANGVKRPGVTSVLGETLGWSKNGLMWWAATEAANAAVAFMQDGAAPEDAARRARMAHAAKRDAAADAGTLAHTYCEVYLRTGVKPVADDLFGDESEVQVKARTAFNKFLAWWETAGLDVVQIETAIIDEKCDYGGTVDYVLRRKSDGKLIVADLKTGKSVFDEVLIQLGAYALLLDTQGVAVDEGLVIHMPVEGESHVIPIKKDILARGGMTFAALLGVYKSRSSLKLDLSDLGGVP